MPNNRTKNREPLSTQRSTAVGDAEVSIKPICGPHVVPHGEEKGVVGAARDTVLLATAP